MPISQMILPEFDHEMATTRKYLERVPMDKLTWKPHEKSMTMGRLAGHVAEMPGWGSITIKQDSLDIGGSYTPPEYSTNQQLVDMFDKNVAETRAAIAGASDETLVKPWTLKAGGHDLFTMPKIGVIRAMVLSHVIHHRGQLSVYLRLNNVPVPATYGPSADEQNM